MKAKIVVAITLAILLCLCALLLYSRAEGAEMPVIYYAHDDIHHVGCWLTEQGGIFCMADPASHNDDAPHNSPYLALR